MSWTAETPSQPGVYRFRNTDHPRLGEPLFFVGYVRLPQFKLGGLEPKYPWQNLRLSSLGMNLHGDCLEPKDLKGEWQGPLLVHELMELSRTDLRLPPYVDMMLSTRIRLIFENKSNDFNPAGPT